MSCECSTSELPSESAAGEQPPSGTSGLQARRGAAHFPGASSHRHQGASSAPAVVFAPKALQTTASATLFVSGIGDMRGREVPARRPSVLCEGNLSLSALVLCEHPAALRSSAAGLLPLRKPGSRQSRLPRLLRSRSSVRLRRGYTWALFLQTSAGVNPAGSLPGAQEAAVQAAGADSVGTSPPQTAPERCTKASPRANYPDSGSEPFRLKPVRPSAHPHRRSLPRLQGA